MSRPAKTDKINAENWDALMKLRFEITHAAIVLKYRGTAPESPGKIRLDVVEILKEQDAAVRGNRSMSHKVSWEDARLALVRTLRLCLEVLDPSDPEEMYGDENEA